MFGLLNAHKPPGVTSRDVVNWVQRRVRPIKVGHAGTLDPLATGVLVLCLGPATRLIPYIQQMRKTYEARFVLGKCSPTDDVEGDVEDVPCVDIPDLPAIQETLTRFTGTIQQRPPAYSAVKVQGQRSYALARRGETVELASRPVKVHALSVIDYAFPQLDLRIECGSGTYVRAIGRDLAETWGTQAVMSQLARTAIGPFAIESAVGADVIREGELSSRLLSPTMALADLPQTTLSLLEAERIARGQFIADRFPDAPGELVALDADGQLLAILTRRGVGWGALRNFATA